jgi:hypothetical protein
MIKIITKLPDRNLLDLLVIIKIIIIIVMNMVAFINIMKTNMRLMGIKS